MIDAAVNCCYSPLYEVEQHKAALNYDPEKLQKEMDRRYACLKAKAENPIL